jgi:hypothetical protein
MSRPHQVDASRRIFEFKTGSVAAELGIVCFGAFFNYVIAAVATRGLGIFDLPSLSSSDLLLILPALGGVFYVVSIPIMITRLIVLENFRTISAMIDFGASRNFISKWVFRSYVRWITQVGWKALSFEFVLLSSLYFVLVEAGARTAISAVAFMASAGLAILLYVPLTGAVVSLLTLRVYGRLQKSMNLPDTLAY